MEGWIKLHRKLIEWEWFDRSEMVHLFVYFLLRANHKSKKWRGIDVLPGQVVTTLDEISKSTNISISVIRTCLKRFILAGTLTEVSTNKYRVVTICNYSDYQCLNNSVDKQSDKQNNNQLADNEQTNDNQLAANNNDKNLSPTHVGAHEAELDLLACYNLLLNNPIWYEPFCMNNRLTPQQFAEYLKQFFADLQDRGETTKSEKDAKHHFSSWYKLNKNKNNETDRKTSKTNKARGLYGEYEAIRDGQRPYTGEETLPDL
ncbi:MAG: hypothetical protein RSD11_01830 [Bacteroides sp.]|uniref:DUF7833 domain-containing protein n=1 Tax=Bacteroides sp. TaxID=29523 RepID=UPI002FC89AE2